MNRVFYVVVLLFLVSFNESKSQSLKDRPAFHVNHVDVCVDTVTFKAILENAFLRDSFGFVKIFSDSTGSEILLLGKESFIHFLPDKGFYKNRLGATLLVHHSYQREETKTMIDYLQPFTTDSLYSRPYITSEFNIDYVNVYENLERTDSLLKFIPVLQNPSVKDYMSWGYTMEDLKKGISQKKYMADYVGKETRQKLFENIKTITVPVTKWEKTRMSSLLHAYGYKRTKNAYLLPNNPQVYLKDVHNDLRMVRLVITLSKKVKKEKILLSDNAVISLKNNTAVFTYFTSAKFR